MGGRKLPDLTGSVFGRLTVIEKGVPNRFGQSQWVCVCDCGTIKTVDSNCLRRGLTKSCGCIRTERLIANYRTHGMSGLPEYRSWGCMKSRCYNENSANFHRWGGRGIKVCDRWLNSFENFLADMGLKPSPAHSLDRFPDKDGDYGPGNCRWATEKEQQGNKGSNVWYEYKGKKMILQGWADFFDVKPDYINYFLDKGKSFAWICEYYSSNKFKRRKKSLF